MLSTCGAAKSLSDHSTSIPIKPAVHAPARRPVARAEAARLERTVDALRRLQITLAGAQLALDAVIAEVHGAVGAQPPAARGTPRALGPAPELRTAPSRSTQPAAVRPQR